VPTAAAQLLADYHEAEATTGVSWAYLAAINFIETRFGRDVGTSTAGAQEPMQFEPATWTQYGHGGNILDDQTRSSPRAGSSPPTAVPRTSPKRSSPTTTATST